ncbi:hypothetical protein AYO44_01525 [Planctomycetaceae bacterium SCGC AG-212-F19]|nr:hypothetical protein AYO44_01525 [Planctomycetaceae bacterium SCGC AG-212-F19]
MALSLVCAKCRSSYRLPDNMAGKSIKCKKCGQMIAAKASGKGSVAGRPAPVGKPRPASRAPSAPAPRRKKSVLPVVVAGLLLFLGCGALGVWYVVSEIKGPASGVAGVTPTAPADAPRSTESAPQPPTKASLPPPPPVTKAEPPKPDVKAKEPDKPKPPEPKPNEPVKPKDPDKPAPADGPLTKLLSDMDAAGKRRDGGAVIQMLNALAQMDRDDKRSKEVAEAINPYLNPEWVEGWVAAEKALKVWVAPASVPALGKLLERQNKDQSSFTMELLAMTKEPAAAEFIAARLTQPEEQKQAAKCLESMGAAGEKAWLASGASENEFARTEARRMLKELKTEDSVQIGQVAKDVKSNLPERRQWAAQWLTDITVDAKLKKAALAAIEAVFVDNNPKVREEAGKAAAKWATEKEDLPTLIVALEGNPSPVARTAILELLAKSNDPRLVNAVAFCLPTERALAVPILKAIGKPAEGAVAAFANHPDAGVRDDVAKLLAEYKTGEAILVTRAVQDLQSTNGTTQVLAAQRLAKLKPVETMRADVIDAAKTFIKSPDGNVRNAGIMLLANWGGKDDVPFFLELMEADPTRAAAMEALGALKDPRGAEAVAKRLAVPNERPVATKSLQAMGPAAEEVAIGYLKDKDPAVVIEICKVLGVVGTKKSLTPLRGLAADKNKQVVQAAGDAFKAVTTRGK